MDYDTDLMVNDLCKLQEKLKEADLLIENLMNERDFLKEAIEDLEIERDFLKERVWYLEDKWGEE